MKNMAFLLTSCFLFFNGCNQRPDKAGKQPTPKPETETNSKAQILNDIVVHEEGGLEISRAFLTGENGNLLPAGNKVRLNETVNLNLEISKGWMAENGFVSIGATQVITTESGEPVLSSPDLFATTPSIAEAKAGHLQLKAGIQKTRFDVPVFIVRYRVWDKFGNGAVSGYYKLFVPASAGKQPLTLFRNMHSASLSLAKNRTL